MKPADWGALIPAVIALLTAVAGLIRAQTAHGKAGNAQATADIAQSNSLYVAGKMHEIHPEVQPVPPGPPAATEPLQPEA